MVKVYVGDFGEVKWHFFIILQVPVLLQGATR